MVGAWFVGSGDSSGAGVRCRWLRLVGGFVCGQGCRFDGRWDRWGGPRSGWLRRMAAAMASMALGFWMTATTRSLAPQEQASMSTRKTLIRRSAWDIRAGLAGAMAFVLVGWGSLGRTR